MSWKQCGKCGFRDELGNAQKICPNCGQIDLTVTTMRNPKPGKTMTKGEFKSLCGQWVEGYRKGLENWELEELKVKILDYTPIFGLDADLVLYNLKQFADSGEEITL